MRKKREPHSVDTLIIVSNAMDKFPDEKEAKQFSKFAIILNDLMEKNGIDQEKMSEDLGISEGSISNYRNGKSEPGLMNIIKIAEYLRVDCHYLMTGVSAKNKTINSDTGLTDDAISALTALNRTKGEDGIEHRKIIDLINYVLGKTKPLIDRYNADPDGSAPVSNVFTNIMDYISPDSAELAYYDENNNRMTVSGNIAFIEKNNDETVQTINEIKQVLFNKRIQRWLDANRIKGGNTK